MHQMEYEQKEQVILMLGTGEGGKTTILRQIQCHYARERALKNILDNKTTLSMVAGAFRRTFMDFAGEVRKKFGTTGFDELDKHISDRSCSGSNLKPNLSLELVTRVRSVWESKNGQQIWENRHKYQLAESLEYYFRKGNLERLVASKRIENLGDFLRVKVRTTGVSIEKLNVLGSKLEIWDFGGQRSERKKWKQTFDKGTAVMLVVALDEFDKSLWEDRGVNRWEESLNIIKHLANSSLLESKPFVIVLNRIDLFQQKINEMEQKGVDLNDHFPELNMGLNYDDASSNILEYMKYQVESRMNNNHPYRTVIVNALDEVEFPKWFEQSIGWLNNLDCSEKLEI